MEDRITPEIRYLRSLLTRTLYIRTSDGRLFVGEFKCTDRSRNIVLGTCAEYRVRRELARRGEETIEAGGDREEDERAATDEGGDSVKGRRGVGGEGGGRTSRFLEEAGLLDPSSNSLLKRPAPEDEVHNRTSPDFEDHATYSHDEEGDSTPPLSDEERPYRKTLGDENTTQPLGSRHGAFLPSDIDPDSRRFVGLVVVPGWCITKIEVRGKVGRTLDEFREEDAVVQKAREEEKREKEMRKRR